MTDFKEMARRIEQECYAQGLSVNKFLLNVGLHPNTARNIKQYKCGPYAYTIAAICRALGKDPNWLFGWEAEQKTDATSL